jgi:DNA replicative helicase MCM subunit Mcm2 (Cdc46/Mcm family)
VNSVELGEYIRIIGIPVISCDKRKDTSFSNFRVRVLGLQRINNPLLPKPLSTFFPNVEIKEATWSFTQQLVESFADSVVPSFMYQNIKLALLLAAVSGTSSLERNAKHNIHILIIDNYDVHLGRLLGYAASFCGRSYTQTTGKLAHSIHNEEQKPFLAAGAYAIARGGMCMIPDIELLGKSDVSYLCEGNTVIIVSLTLSYGKTSIFFQ